MRFFKLFCFIFAISLSSSSFAVAKDIVPFTQLGYVWANLPSTASYIPSTLYNYNSTGATNVISRTAVGTYIVRFPGLTLGKGNVQVTAYGPGAAYCKVGYWIVSGSALNVSVYCYNAQGVLSDQRFSAIYMSA